MKSKIRQYIKWFLIYFSLFLLCYGLLIFRFGRGVEEVSYLPCTDTYYVFYACGRWVYGLYRLFFGFGSASPFAAGIVTGIYVSVTLILQTKMLNIERPSLKLLFGVISICCMWWTSHLVYSVQSDATALIILLSTIAAKLAFEGKRKPWWTLMLLYLSICGFQTAFIYFWAMYILLYLSKRDRKFTKAEVKRASIALLMTFLAIILYFITRVLIVKSGLIPQAVTDYCTQYNEQQTQWPNIFRILSGDMTDANVTLQRVVSAVLVTPARNILGCAHWGQWVYTTALIPAVCLTAAWWKKAKSIGDKCTALLPLALIYFPYTASVVLMEPSMSRLFLPEPLVAAGLWCLFLRQVHLNLKGKYTLFVLMALITLKGIYYGALYASDEKYYFDSKVRELTLMYIRGQQETIRHGADDCPILLCGSPDRGLSSRSLAKFFAPQHVSMKHQGLYQKTAIPGFSTLKYASYTRLPNLRDALPEEELQYGDKLRDMPVWPQIGSVAYEHGVVLIKLGN